MENKTEIRELSQSVHFSENDNTQLEQSACYDPADEWLNIVHDGNEISLSLQNWEKLKHLGNRVISGISEHHYKHLRGLKMKDAVPILATMTELQILDLMREDAKTEKLRHWNVTGFTKLLMQELFKRNNMGYKSLGSLSRTQRSFIESFNIYKKQFYGKP